MWASHVHAHLQIDVHVVDESSGSRLAKRVSITDNVVRIDRFDQPQYVLYKLDEHTLYTIHQTARHYSKMRMHFEETQATVVQPDDFSHRVNTVQKAKLERMVNELVEQKDSMTQHQYQAALDAISNLQLEFFGVDSISNEIVYLKKEHCNQHDSACQHIDIIRSGHKMGAMCVSSIDTLGMTDAEYTILSKFIGFMREIDQSLISDYLVSEGRGFLPILLEKDQNKERVLVKVTRVAPNPDVFNVPATYKML